MGEKKKKLDSSRDGKGHGLYTLTDRLHVSPLPCDGVPDGGSRGADLRLGGTFAKRRALALFSFEIDEIFQSAPQPLVDKAVIRPSRGTPSSLGLLSNQGISMISQLVL